MHVSLPDLKYKPPFWCSIIIGCLCFHSKAFSVLLICQLICMLASHLIVSAMPILGCQRRLLFLLFIKLDNASKCGVAWFIMKEHKKSCISRILSRTVLCLAIHILPTPIKRFYIINLILDCQSAMDLPLVETYPSSIYGHQLSWNCQVIQTCIS